MGSQALVRQFHKAVGTIDPRRPHVPAPEVAALRTELSFEEAEEADAEWAAFETGDEGASLARLAKELGDQLYVTYGAFESLGIDGDEVLAEIHRSNMTKLVDGKAIRREDGKVLKGPNYEEANIEAVLGRQYAREAA